MTRAEASDTGLLFVSGSAYVVRQHGTIHPEYSFLQYERVRVFLALYAHTFYFCD